MKTILLRLRDPYFRYSIKSDSWRSVWIYWGWTPFGIRRVNYEGSHVWLSIGPASIINSNNRGKPNDAVL